MPKVKFLGPGTLHLKEGDKGHQPGEEVTLTEQALAGLIRAGLFFEGVADPRDAPKPKPWEVPDIQPAPGDLAVRPEVLAGGTVAAGTAPNRPKLDQQG